MPDYGALDPKAYFAEHGYFVFRKLLPAQILDALLAEYRSAVLTSKRPFFRQTNSRWEPNHLNSYGYCQNSFLDIHDLHGMPGYSSVARDVFCSAPMREALFRVTGERDHNLMQSMFFDQNTATPAHQDNYYLDSVPGGHLLAAWIALEDIDERAGRFYVIPGSHRHRLDRSGGRRLSDQRFVEAVGKYAADHSASIYAPALAKGDVLFWGSATVHGSLPTRDERFSRKSLTAHYMPSRCRFGNVHGEEYAVQYGDAAGMRYRLDERKYSFAANLKNRVWLFIARHPLLKNVANQVRHSAR